MQLIQHFSFSPCIHKCACAHKHTFWRDVLTTFFKLPESNFILTWIPHIHYLNNIKIENEIDSTFIYSFNWKVLIQFLPYEKLLHLFNWTIPYIIKKIGFGFQILPSSTAWPRSSFISFQSLALLISKSEIIRLSWDIRKYE